jgi:iron complex transport system ATP-binding protein
VLMDAGRVIHQGKCSQAATHRALEDVFAGRIIVREVQGQWVALPNEAAP